jgi:predicted transcriptional regulator
MTTKEVILDRVRRLPEDVSFEDVITELESRRRIEEGLRQLEAGEVVSHDEVKRRVRIVEP